MDMLRTLTDLSLAAFGTATVAAQTVASAGPAGNGIYEWINRFGALALCAFMVLQNYRQSDMLGKIITRKDEEISRTREAILQINKELLQAIQANTHGTGVMIDALNKRPCIMPNPLKEGD